MNELEQPYVDRVPKPKQAGISQRAGVADALKRAVRSAGGNPNHVAPRNRAEARRFMRGAGPHMRFKYEVGDDGVRRGVRVRV